MVTKETGLSRDYIIHPGETLQEILEDREMSQKELAIRCGVSEKHVSTVLSGKKNISSDFAKKLEYALGIDAIFWMNLQNNYDNEILKFEEVNNITDEEIDVLKQLAPILSDYKKESFIPNNISNVDEVLELRRLFKISNLLNIPRLNHIGAYRMNQSKYNLYVMYAWEKYCELIDNDKIDNKLDIKKLVELIPEIKSIMFHDSANLIIDLKKVFSKCGIKFYLMKNYSGAPIQGYIRNNFDNTISLFMTIRGSFADIFWFSLFHEIAHIINGDAKNSFMDYEDIPFIIEEKANNCAANILINNKSYEEFVLKKDFSIDAIRRLANENNVKIYMIIGRLMKDKYIEWNQYSNYRARYALSNN